MKTVALLTCLCSIVAACAEGAEKPVFLLRSPQNYQVFQRTSANQGATLVEGQCSDGSSLSARIDGGPWQNIPFDKDGKFSERLATRAGGWYKVEVRRSKGGEVLPADTIEHVGVGEVFIVAGQSNSCNYGSEKQQTATGRVSSFDGRQWTLANDPQPGGGGKGGSFMPAFGDALVKRLGVPVAVAACGVGSTSVRQWLPKGSIITNLPTKEAYVKQISPGKWEATGQPFEGLMKRVDALGPHGFRAILWHQGESDAGQARGGAPADRQITGKQYTEYMQQLINATRQRAQWEIPWFVAQATYHSAQDAADEEFCAAQKALWISHIARQGPDTDALGGEYRAGVHFNARGLQAHGRLWAEKVGNYIDAELKLPRP